MPAHQHAKTTAATNSPRARTQTINRLHRLLGELSRWAKKFLSATQARALIATITPRDLVGKTRRRLAVELIDELTRIDKRSRMRTPNFGSWSPTAAAP